MGRDGAPRLKLTVIKDEVRGPRLCRGCGGPLMPSAKSTAVFCGDACRSRHWRRMRRGEGSDRGGEGRRDGFVSAVRGGVDGRCRPPGLRGLLLSRLPQTGLAHAARALRRGVSLRVRRRLCCFGRRGRTPFRAGRGGRMVRSEGFPGRVDGARGCCPRDSWGWCLDDRDGRQCDPAALRRAGQAGAGLGRDDEQRPVAARGRRSGDRADALLRGREPVGERGVVHGQRGDPDVRRGCRPGLHDRPQLSVGVLALAEGAPAGGRLAHHPQSSGQHPR